MKKLLIGLLFSMCGVSHAITYQSVRASTDTALTPTLQVGTANLSSMTVVNGNFPTLKSTGTATLSGTVTLGAAGKSVTVSSNAVLSGALIANSSAGSSGQILQSQGPGTTPNWVSASASSILSSTNTWTGGQTFNANITLSSNVIDGSATQGTAGQSLQTNGGSAPTWVNVPSKILSTTSTWTAVQNFSTGTFSNIGVTNNISGLFSGKVAQVVTNNVTSSSATVLGRSTSYMLTNSSVTINISSSTSKIIVFASGIFDVDFSTSGANLTIMRGLSDLYSTNGAFFLGTTTSFRTYDFLATPIRVDTPGTTGPTSYEVWIKANNGNTATWCQSNAGCSITAIEIIP